LKIQQQKYDFNPNTPDAGVFDEVQDLTFSKCDSDYIEGIHTDVYDFLFHSVGDEAICMDDGQELNLYGNLESFKRSTLKVELEACKEEECYTGS
jgi:hypothetical protein